MITNDAICTRDLKSKIDMAKAAFNKCTNLITSKLEFNLRMKLEKCYIWNIVLYGAETWTIRNAHQECLESFEMWYWTRMEMSWTDRVRNKVTHRATEERNIVHTIKRGRASWIGHILGINCLRQYVIEEKIGRTGRRGKSRRQLLDDVRETRRYWKLKDRTLWRTRFGRGPDCVMTTQPCFHYTKATQ
jgi:hypothetical protein